MEELATIVFERTPAAAVAIKAAGDAIPRQLRTLLLAIDGRSPVSQYVPFLTSLAPLSEKFAQLEVMGFARRRAPIPEVRTAEPGGMASPAAAATSATAVKTTLPASGSAAQPVRRVTEAELREFASQMAYQPLQQSLQSEATDLEATLTSFVSSSSGSSSNNNPYAAGGFSASLSISGQTPSPSRPSAPASNAPVAAFISAGAAASPRRPVLADLLARMQAYLSDVAGMEGLPVALMLEQIMSLGQLRRELPSYAALVASYGGDSAPHIDMLTNLLDLAQS